MNEADLLRHVWATQPRRLALLRACSTLTRRRAWTTFSVHRASVRAASGLALGGCLIAGTQAQVAQISQQVEQAKQAQLDIKLVFKQLTFVRRPTGGWPEIVGIATRVSKQGVFTGLPFFTRVVGRPVHDGPRPVLGRSVALSSSVGTSAKTYCICVSDFNGAGCQYALRAQGAF